MSAIQTQQDAHRMAIGDVETLAQARDAFRTELAQSISRLGLTSNIADLDIRGYTVVRDAAPIAFFKELRQAILALAADRKKRGVAGDPRALFSESITETVRYGGVFEEALLNPKLNALMAYLLGDGYVVNATSAAINRRGTPALFLHSDNAYIPDPFPNWALTATSVWVTDAFSEESGATRVVPGSHRLARHPMAGEGDADSIPIECPAGSVIVWNGATWHGNYPRRAPGQRVTFHTSCVRMHIRTFSDNDRVPQEIVDRNPQLAQVLGRGLPHGAETEDGARPDLRANAARRFARRL